MLGRKIELLARDSKANADEAVRVSRELVLKELRVFFRDSTQWSQLILLAVLVVVYVVNIRYLPLKGDGMTFFIVNVIPFLNLALSGFVLASIAARFLFPAVIAGFLLQHAIQGWCPPLAVIRRLLSVPFTWLACTRA